MFEIHTPNSWYSISKFPSIIVDDNGLIYNSDDYHKLIRNPIGKIDYDSGYIYGEDYLNLIRNPIGKIEQNETVTMIFGEDCNKLLRTPIFYIKDEEVYSYEEYHKLISTPSYYIKSDSVKNNNSINSTNRDAVDDPEKNNEKSTPDIRKTLRHILGIFAMVAIGIGIFCNFIVDSTYAPVLFIAISVGFVSTFVLVKVNKIVTNVLCAEFTSVVVCWIGIVIIDIPNLNGIEILGTLLLVPLMIAVMMAIPSIIIGLVVYGIKKLFKKSV